MSKAYAADLVVVGGGIIGCATALELARRGASVTIVERGKLGGESSWAGGGILFPLLPWRYGSLLNRLITDSRTLYPPWISQLQAETGQDPEYLTSGMLIADPDRDAANRWLASSGEPHQWQGHHLWLPNVAQVRNPRLMATLRMALAEHGVTVLEQTAVSGWEHRPRKITAARCADLRLSADHYIVAAGAWSADLLAPLGAPPQVRPIRGQMLLFDAAHRAPPHILVRDGTYLIPRQDGLVLVGSTLEDVGFNREIKPEVRAELHQAGIRLWPALAELQPIRHWCGFRPGSPDNIPTLAQHPDFENLTLHAGHFRYGVTLAPFSAKLLAQRLAGESDLYSDELGWVAR